MTVLSLPIVDLGVINPKTLVKFFAATLFYNKQLYNINTK